MKNKRGQVVSNLINGTTQLIIIVIISLVIISTLLGASLLTSNSAEENVSEALRDNLTTGLTEVGNKIPTILLIAAVVILFGVLAFLIIQARRSGIIGGNTGGL